jgi:hypothetical protein
MSVRRSASARVFRDCLAMVASAVLCLGPATAPAAAQEIEIGGIQIEGGAKTAGTMPGGILPKPGPDEVELRRHLRQAQAHLGSKDLRRVAEKYQIILEYLENGKDQDYFQPSDNDGETTTSVRGDIDRWLAAMPRDVRDNYELRYGGAARQLVQAAVRNGDLPALEKAYRLYFHTEAGQTAAFLLGEQYLEQGHWLRAALCFTRLLASPGGARFEPSLSFKLAASQYWAGMNQDAQVTLARLRQEHPRARLNVAGRDMPLFGDDRAALEWLAGIVGDGRGGQTGTAAQWLVYGGNPARSATTQGDEPVVVPWRTTNSLNPEYVALSGRGDERDRGLLPELVRRFSQRSVVALPSGHPLIVRDVPLPTKDETNQGHPRGAVALVRTLRGLAAIDVATGKLVWQRDEPEPARQAQATEQVQVTRFGRVFAPTAVPANTLEQRLWGDGVGGQLASDGELAYVVQQQASDEGQNDNQDEEDSPSTSSRPLRPMNVLQAIALKSGETAVGGGLHWQINGREEEKDAPFAGAYFLGPPLPLGGALYVLAEFNSDRADQSSGEVRLLAIDPRVLDSRRRPKLLWSQKVAMFDDSVLMTEGHFGFGRYGPPLQRAIVRRQAGLSPSYADGLLVCPTGVGAVVAMDLTTRSLRWGYKYATIQPNTSTPSSRLQSAQSGNAPPDLGRWAESPVVIVSGRALFTPPLASELHCVNLADGKKLWSVPRDDGLYLAGVHGGNAVVVGSRKIRAFPLSSIGAIKPAWEIELPGGSVPAGRGFISAGQYYLPLSTAEIAVIDAEQGKIVRKLPSPEGRPLGNLVCHEDIILSQGAVSIDCLYQRKPLESSLARRLKQDAADAKALLLAAEVAKHDGKPEEALGLLRRSYQARSHERARELLVDGLLGLLRADVAKHHGLLAELAKLADTPAQRTEYLALLSKDLRRQGKPLEAFDVLLQLAESTPQGGTTAIAPGDQQHDAPRAEVTVGRDLLVRSSLAELYRAASGADRAELDRRIDARLQEALPAADATPLRCFLDRFAFHSSADAARRELVARGIVGRGGAPLEVELSLAALERSADAATARWTIAQRARFLAAAERPDEAAAVFRRLQEEFGDQVCVDGRTGKQMVEDLPADSPVRKWLSPVAAVWPQGKVVSEPKQQPALADTQTFRVPLEGDAAWAAQTALYLNLRSGALIAKDRLGRRLWELDLNRGTAGGMQRDGWLNRAVAWRHLLVLYLGNEVVALDMLGPGGKPQKDPLWRRSLIDAPPGLDNSGAFAARFEQAAWGAFQRLATDQWTGKPLGRLGPVTAGYVCFQRGEELLAVQPLTGRTLWSRRGIPPGSYFFGNDELIAVAVPDRSAGLLLRAGDGEVLDRPDLFAARRIVAAAGPRIVVWEDDAGKHVLRMIDAAAKQSWALGRFAAGSKACVVDNQSLAVMQPDGEFHSFRLADGKAEFDKPYKVSLSGKLGALYAVKWRDTYMFAVSRAEQPREQVIWSYGVVSLNDPNRPQIAGKVYGVGPGGKTWSASVDNGHWVLDQPLDLPLLVFSSGSDYADFRGRAASMLLCLDKRTGKTIYQERNRRVIQGVEVSADEEQHTATLRYADALVTLKFTDQPDEEPKKDAAKEPVKKEAAKK